MGDLIPIRKFIDKELLETKKLNTKRMIAAYVLLGAFTLILGFAVTVAIISVTR